jgi:signal transduction histidine kinase
MNAPVKFIGLLRGNRIVFRVFAIFGSLLLGTTIIYGLLIIPLQKDSLQKVMYSQAATVSRSIIQACTDAMLTNDSGFIVEHSLQVVTNNSSIQSIVVVPKQGPVLNVTSKGWSIDEQSTFAAFKSETSGIFTESNGTAQFRYTSPVLFSGVSWGVMQINFDTREYDENISQMYLQLFYITVIALLSILPIGYFFALWLTRPISIISEAAARVSSGDLEARVHTDRADEIGQLANSFNQMVDALRLNRNKLQSYNQELEFKVAERTRDLDELNKTLDQRVHDEIAKRKQQEAMLIQQSRLAAMGEMIGAIAHQWRQPLNALSLVLQNIRMQHQSGVLTGDSMMRMEEKAERLVTRMSATIDDFRNFFKPATQPQPFDLRSSIQSAVDIMDGLFNKYNIRVSMEFDETIEVFGNSSEFAQVMLNLLSNAKDALLESEQPDPCVMLRVARVADRIHIDVEDNGGGIPAAILDSVFDPYFTTKEEGKGSGIGLYMSKMIVESNFRGRLKAANTNDGVCFTIDLPSSGMPEMTNGSS